MFVIITTIAKYNSYLTVMDLKMGRFLVEMSKDRKIGGQMYKLINQSNFGKEI